MSKTAIIIGAGPAGLTAAYELLLRTDYIPLIFEASSDIGGISKTVKYKGNRMDIGGHRFFSKSKRVMDWWLHFMPIDQASLNDFLTLTYHGKTTNIESQIKNKPDDPDQVMLVRNRKSRIYFLRKFFDYPISLNLKTLSNLGPVRILKIAMSYISIRLFPIKNEKSLEDFFINRFGKELYLTFFKDYTEKVWGISCKEIKPEWGAQRVKGLSVSKAILHSLKKIVTKGKLSQKNTQTSLIEQFLYPKLGPGQLWETVAKEIEKKGGKIFFNQKAVGFNHAENKILSVEFKDPQSGNSQTVYGDLFFSTMPILDLIKAMRPSVPKDVQRISAGLQYRDFITVGLLVKKMKVSQDGKPISDNWIYIQEKDVKLGRLQIFNNWSPALVADQTTTWMGLEYFCNEGDELWNKSDAEFKIFAAKELESIGMIDVNDVLDSVVIRMPKTYPSYTGTYDQIETITNFTNLFENLFLIGRNGMHKYNNQDHSMLTAMTAVDNIESGRLDKSNIWSINTEEEYHEEK